MGPSAIVHPDHAEKGVAPQAMTQADIDEAIASYVRAAVAARDLGFDGVELHGAHGYLIDQFFWEQLNQRTDRYGGSLEARLTFGIELLQAVRAAVGPDFPIVLGRDRNLRARTRRHVDLETHSPVIRSG